MGNLLGKKEGDITQLSPNELYTHCDWDVRVVRKLISDKKMAPLSRGRVDPSDVQEGYEECPICFLYYTGGLNRSKCCKKGICTECYLQVRRPNQPTNCPFCNHSQYIVSFTGPLSRDEIAKEMKEQRKVQELKVQMRNDEIERDKAREDAKRSKLSKPNSNLQSAIEHSQLPPISEEGASGSSSVTPSPFDKLINNPSEADLEELMLMEAIRLSLENRGVNSTQNIDTLTPPPPLAVPPSSDVQQIMQEVDISSYSINNNPNSTPSSLVLTPAYLNPLQEVTYSRSISSGESTDEEESDVSLSVYSNNQPPAVDNNNSQQGNDIDPTL